MKFSIIKYFFPITCAIICSCSNSNVAGGSNQTGNAKALVSAVDISGTPLSNITVTIRPVSYKSDSIMKKTFTGTTNELGKFMIDSLKVGNYSIELNDLDSLADFRSISISEQDIETTIILPSDTLIPFAILSGKIINTDNFSGKITIFGLERYISVDKNGDFIIPNLPAKEPFIIQYQSDNINYSPIIDTTEKLISGDTIKIQIKSQWENSYKIRINTTNSGANITDTLINYPLLVRISKEDVFKQSKNDGSDIRFYSEDQSPLSYEIEEWDSINNSASIWVLVPTILGDDSLQSIQIKYGNSEAVSISNSKTVFLPSNNFLGVWHMDSTLEDATLYENSGTIFGSIITENGNIGKSKHILDQEKSSHIEIPNESHFDITGQMTLSAWIKVDSLTIASWDDCIISKGNELTGYTLGRANGLSSFSYKVSTNISNYYADGTTSLDTTVLDTNFHFIVGVQEKDTIIYYYDGIEESRSYQPYQISTNNTKLHIGNISKTGINTSLNGYIDEVRVVSSARSKSWIKFSFETQKANQSVLIWE